MVNTSSSSMRFYDEFASDNRSNQLGSKAIRKLTSRASQRCLIVHITCVRTRAARTHSTGAACKSLQRRARTHG
ncbi:hypothetical protein PIB30_009745, partial [Stylosanthes scabra]|nr:hypothetical protein [Stylosanthes scabra]